MDELVASALIILRDNPGHRRSPFVMLTKKGQAIFKKMRRRETKVLELLAHDLCLDRLEETAEMLAKLKDNLVKMREEGGQHG